MKSTDRETTTGKNEQWKRACMNVDENIERTRSSETWRNIETLRTNNKENIYTLNRSVRLEKFSN